MLAGFRGDRIDEDPEIIEFAERKGLAIDLIDQVKHMNADQATCGYGCSGNPYDAYWAFDPPGHGDLHELGHGLVKGRFLFDSWSPGHTATNFYSFFPSPEHTKSSTKHPNARACLLELCLTGCRLPRPRMTRLPICSNRTLVAGVVVPRWISK